MINKPLYPAVALLLFGSSAVADVFQLEPDTWELLVIPGDPAGFTIETLLADDLGSQVYGQDWIIYTFDSESQVYGAPPPLNSELDAGQAFWILHTGPDSVELDIPENLSDANVASDPACAGDHGCYFLPLSANRTEGSRSFHLLGAPFSSELAVSDVRFVTQTGGAACANGCDLDEARSAGYTTGVLQTYNSSTGSYEALGSGDTVQPWKGFWISASSDVQPFSPALIIPGVTAADNMCDVGVTTAQNVVIQRLDKPEYLVPYTDPGLGARVTRITNSTFGQVRKPSYSTMQAWNADESLILLYQTGQGGGFHILLDGQNYQPVAELDINPVDVEEVFWSHTDPDTLFYVSASGADAGVFNEYSVSQRRASRITDFNGLCDSSPTGGRDILMQSHDDDLFGFRCTGTDGQTRMLSHRISTGETLSTVIGGGTPWADSTAPMPGPSGERFWFQGATLALDLSTVERRLDVAEPGEHSSVGLSHNGEDALFQTVFNASPLGCDGDADNGIGHLVEHNLETGSCRTFFTESDGYPYTTSSTHVSALAYRNQGWVAMSSVGRLEQFDVFTSNQPAPALLSEIYLANTDPGNPVTCRLAHHRSFGKAATQGGYAPYFGEPHATISPSGTRIVFGSDWYDSGSVDSYVVELPGFQRRRQ